MLKINFNIPNRDSHIFAHINKQVKMGLADFSNRKLCLSHCGFIYSRADMKFCVLSIA